MQFLMSTSSLCDRRLQSPSELELSSILVKQNSHSLLRFFIQLQSEMVSPHPRSDHREGASTSSSMTQSSVEGLLEDHRLGSHDSSSTSTETCIKLNDSVYELYAPSTTKANIDIVFFHGLQLNALSAGHISTWTARSTGAPIWPKHWIPEDYPYARVLTVGYDERMSHGRMDLYLIAESLLVNLLMADVGQNRPVILVGHSFGGLVIKKLCVHAGRTGNKEGSFTSLLEHIRGIFYFGTPQRGWPFDLIEKLNWGGELGNLLRLFNKDVARLSEEFEFLRQKYPGWRISGVGEALPTDLGGGYRPVIVEEASARCENFIMIMEDHFSICRPRDKRSIVYQFFVNFLQEENFVGDLQTLPQIQVGPLETTEAGMIETCLDTDSVIGLWGMGGVGKTTLCKAVFNRKRSSFEYTLFVENVRFILGAGNEFVKKILENVHQRGRRMKRISDISFLEGKEILVVLDAVESDRDIEVVHKLQDICSHNSRFLLTSRDRSIMRKVDSIRIVEVKPLDDSSSELLFRSYAIPYYGPLPKWQQKCLEDIVKHCRGLPLVSEIVGRYLRYNEEKDIWERTLEAFAVADGLEAESKLKVSYDSLRYEEQQMFLDAATIFQERISSNGLWPLHQRQWTLREAKAIWRTTYRTEAVFWRTLVDRSLVFNVAEDSEIKMHHQLRNLGKKLAEEMTGFGDNRIQVEESDSKSLSGALQQRKRQLQKIHTIQLKNERYLQPGEETCRSCKLIREVTSVHKHCLHRFPRISVAKLHKMDNLRYLQLDNCAFAGREVILPQNLVLYRSVSIGKNVSFSFCQRLVILNMISLDQPLLPGSFCQLKVLQFLHLEAKDLKCLPELFGDLKQLQVCYFRCPLLKELPVSFGNLSNLEQLTMDDCGSLERFPASFGSLENLQQLSLRGCSNLQMLPDSFGGLGNLQQLALRGCKNLDTLPNSFGDLGSLLHLSVEDCGSLKRFPESLGDLGNLQQLALRGCENLQRLPDTFGSLGYLRELKIEECEKLESLPDSFGSLESMQQLTLWGCANLETLSDSFGGLGNMLQLKIDDCGRLPANLRYTFLLQLDHFQRYSCG